MSISQINKLFQNKGCNIAISCVLGLTVVSMFAAYGFGRGCGSATPGQPGQNPIAEVNGVAITAVELDRELDSQFQGSELPANFRMQMLASTLRRKISEALILKLAKDQGIEVSTDEAKSKIIQQQFDTAKMNLISSQKLRPDANQQEFENAFKGAYGRSLIDTRKEMETQIAKFLEEPGGEEKIQGIAAAGIWLEKNKAKYLPTDEQLATDNKTIVIKEISVDATLAGKEKPQAKAEAILKEIKGGLSFEAAMDKYLPKPEDKKKKASDITKDVLESAVVVNPDLTPLMTLKPGEMTGVVNDAGTPSIIKIVRKGLPTDFDAKKAALKDQKAAQEAGKALTAQIDKLANDDNIKWHDEAYHVLFEYSKLTDPDALKNPDLNKKMLEIVDKALAAQKKGTPFVAVNVAKLAMDDAIKGLPADKANELKLKVLPEYVTQNPEPDVKIELANLYIDLGKKDETQAALDSAAVGVSAHQDPSGKMYWAGLNGAIQRAKTKKLIEDTQVADLKKKYEEWQKAFDEAEKARKQAEADAKAEEARRKKLEEELKKTGQKDVTQGDGTKKPDEKKPEGNQ